MLENISKKTVVAKKIRHCKSLMSKFIGLMFSKKINDEALIFHFEEPTCVELHMFFVFFPIDVIFLDSNKKVIEIKESFLPFTIYFPRCCASYVVEVSCGTIKKSKTEISDVLRFADN
ncbi:MAG: DUF192 domain-containing protein [archaeon]